MGWLDISQIVYDFQVNASQIIHLAAGRVSQFSNQESYGNFYSDDQHKAKRHELRKDGVKLAGHKEVLVLGAVDEQRILKALSEDQTNFILTDLHVPHIPQSALLQRKRTILSNPQRLSVFFYDMWSMNSEILKSQQRYRQGYVGRALLKSKRLSVENKPIKQLLEEPEKSSRSSSASHESFESQVSRLRNSKLDCCGDMASFKKAESSPRSKSVNQEFQNQYFVMHLKGNQVPKYLDMQVKPKKLDLRLVNMLCKPQNNYNAQFQY